MSSRDKKQQNSDAVDLRKYMTTEEQIELDQLLWSPQIEVPRYRKDPAAFAREVLHIDLAPYQEKALQLLVEKRRLCLRGPHGTGKTVIASIAVLWFLSVYEECKVPTTASAWRQLKDFLWPEIHKWALKADWWRVGLKVRDGKELMKLRVELGANRFAFAISSNDEAKIEGAHSESLLYIFDEAKEISPAIWDAAEGALGTPNTFALALSTPGDSTGRFFEIQTDREKYRDWATMYVTSEEVIAAGRMTQEWKEGRAREWGVDSTMYKRRVLGHFAEDSGDTLIPLSLVERANERWYALMGKVKELIESGVPEDIADRRVWGNLTHIGCDPARFGTNKTGWAFRYEPGIKYVEQTEKQDTMQTTGRLVQHMQGNTAVANVDVNGLGAGVFDRANELYRNDELRQPKDKKLPVHAVNSANATKATDKSKQMTFNRLRDYLWWRLREVLEEKDTDFVLPPDDILTRDLTTPKWTQTSRGKVQIEEKDEIKKRLGRSPDSGDAVVLALAPDILPYKPLVDIL